MEEQIKHKLRRQANLSSLGEEEGVIYVSLMDGTREGL